MPTDQSFDTPSPAQGEIVLFHFDSRRGPTSRPAVIVEVNDDDTCELQVFAGADVDIASDLAACPHDLNRVPGALAATAGYWTR